MRRPISPLSLRVVLLASCMAAGGCAGDKTPKASAALLAGIPVVPGSFRATTAAGADAVEAGFVNPAPVDSVAGWYRRWLLEDGWQMTSDVPVGSRPGGVTLHAEKAGRPVWIMIQPRAAGGSSYSVIGAETDSAPRR